MKRERLQHPIDKRSKHIAFNVTEIGVKLAQGELFGVIRNIEIGPESDYWQHSKQTKPNYYVYVILLTNTVYSMLLTLV